MAQAAKREAEDLEARIEELEAAIDEDPTNAELHKELGNTFHKSKAFHLALAEYRTACRLDAGYYPAVYNMGNTHFEMGEQLAAVICWQRALLLKPDLEQAVYNIGFAYYTMATAEKDRERKRRFLDDAVAFFVRALEMAPNHADTHLHLGLAYYELERFDDAVRHYREALAVAPDDAAVHYNLGNVYYEKGERDTSYFPKALEEYRQAAKHDAKDLKSRNNIADCYLRMGDLKKARKQIQKVLDDFPEYLPAHCTLGEIFAKEGNPQAAIGEFEMVLALDPDEHGILHKFAGNALLEEYMVLVQDRPDDPELRLRLGRAFKVLGMAYNDSEYLHRAVDEFTKAGSIGSGTFRELTEVFLKLRRWEEALAAVDACLERDPEDVVALTLKAEVFARTGDRERVVEILQMIRRRRFS